MADTIRDHLANERTYLAWVRTALALIGLGFVLARMGLFLRHLATTVGARQVAGPQAVTHAADVVERARDGHELVITGIVFLAIGTFLVGWSGRMYERNRRAIDVGQYVPARRTVVLLTCIIVAGGLFVLGLAIWSEFG
jgi:putative membrane protein